MYLGSAGIIDVSHFCDLSFGPGESLVQLGKRGESVVDRSIHMGHVNINGSICSPGIALHTVKRGSKRNCYAHLYTSVDLS